ncbi:MAG: exonuclease domain-containing protein [Oscillospiraceae bacterium]
MPKWAKVLFEKWEKKTTTTCILPPSQIASDAGIQRPPRPDAQAHIKIEQKGASVKISMSEVSIELGPKKARPLPPQEYVVLDLETTGLSSHRDKIIEIAAVRFRDGEIDDSYETLVNPGCRIPPEATGINNITDDMVAQAPAILQATTELLEFLGDSPVVAHNAKFDMGFIERYLHAWPEIYDTLTMSKQAFPDLRRYNLPAMCYSLRIESATFHRALADVMATQQLFEKCCAALSGKPVEVRKYPANINKLKLTDIKPRTEELDGSNPLYGKKIVFTGELSISRKDAAQLAADSGALLRASVTSKTDILIVGNQDQDIVGFDGTSGKQEKAAELNSSGKANIQVLGEQEFFEMLDGKVNVCLST